MMKILLREITEADLPILFRNQSDPEASQMAAYPSRDEQAFLSHWKTVIEGNPANIKLGIVVDGTLVGDIGSWEQNEKRFVGYWLGREYWGRGIATRALTEFLKRLQVRPLYATAALHNRASIRVLEKCGFKMLDRLKTTSAVHGREIEEVLMVRT